MTLRNATVADLPAINAIYNYYVPVSTCTYQITPETEESRQAWFSGRKPQHPVIVAVDGETVVAWGSLSAFHKREAYAGTVENSVYVHHERQRQGLGRLLMEELIRRARTFESLHTVIAIISADQEGSIGLHHSLGFKQIGLLKEVGRKFGHILDVMYMQYMLRE